MEISHIARSSFGSALSCLTAGQDGRSIVSCVLPGILLPGSQNLIGMGSIATANTTSFVRWLLDII